MCDTSLKGYFQDELNGTISVKINVLEVEIIIKLLFEALKLACQIEILQLFYFCFHFNTMYI